MATPRELAVDRLADQAEPAQIMWVEGLDVVTPRDPHRHDYHELIWIRSGSGLHLIDGEPLPVEPGTITVIGRGQVHVFAEGEDLHGAVLRIRDEMLDGEAQRVTAGWLFTGRCGRSVAVPVAEADRLEATLHALSDELERPPGPSSVELERHLVSVILLWIDRWYDESRAERPEADDAEVQMLRRFVRALERDYATHHDVAHYADELRVPAAALTHALTQVTGRGTKELVLDRVMQEAARLLRFTDLNVQQVALRVGYEDPLYFSRAFKRQFGEAPMTYRARAQGKDSR